MMNAPQTICNIQAELCRAMGNAARQEIVHLLRTNPMRVSDIASALKCTQPTVSRHLITLRNAGVVVSHRDGNSILYSIANPKIMQVCDLMREVLLEQIGQNSKLIEGL
jgi:DNA-binding transcriptional ArsR family regulator